MASQILWVHVKLSKLILNYMKKNLFLKDFIYLFSERGEGKEKERERNSC